MITAPESGTRLLFLCVVVLGTTAPSIAQQLPVPFGVHHGTVDMRMEMLGVTLSLRLVFGDSGRTQATRLTGFANGRAVNVSTLEARGHLLVWDNGTKRGQRTPLKGNPRGPLSLISGLKPDLPLVPSALDTVTILSRGCVGRTYSDSGVVARLWTWNGVPLRVGIKGGNAEVTLEATSIDITSTLPKDSFDVPDDVAIVDQ